MKQKRKQTNYERGRALEYKIKAQLEEQGYAVMRSAGSHGPYDLIALDRTGKVRFIQLKRKASGEEVRDVVTYTAEVSEEYWVVIDKRRQTKDGRQD